MPSVLLMLNAARLNETLACLNLSAVDLKAILMETSGNKMLRAGSTSIPIMPLNAIGTVIKKYSDLQWLIGGLPTGNISEVWQTAKFLMDEGVARGHIFNLIVLPHISRAWIGNLRAAEAQQYDYFCTGISYAEVGLDLEQFLGLKGINLSCSNQDLKQGYHTARHVFEHQRSIQFVLMGLAPYAFRYDNQKAFAVSSRNLQYLLTLNDYPPLSDQDNLLMRVLSDGVKEMSTSITAADADPNFESLKYAVNKCISPSSIANWEFELDNLTKKFWADTVQQNLKVFEDYIKLCLDHGAKPVGVVLPFAPIIRRHYPKDLLLHFRLALHQFERLYDFALIDLFDLPADYTHFYNPAHLNVKGAKLASAALNYELIKRKIIPPTALLSAHYDQLNALTFLLDKTRFNELQTAAFESSVERVRAKDKIKIGFVLYDASMWCGDALYRLFEKSARYAVTVFACLRQDQADDHSVRIDFHHGIEQFRSAKINAVAIENDDDIVEPQDVLIYLTPYADVLTKHFKIQNLSAHTLICYIPYGMHTSSNVGVCNLPIVSQAWKIFLDTLDSVNFYRTNCRTGAPNAVCSGYPKMDYFFADSRENYVWKEAQPHSTKIIWAPHWSINDGIRFSTFHWNYQFFFEYAKAHPETSWVVKPHPNLLFSAVKENIFENADAFEQYLKRWNALPNAKVETGAYYYDIFASSDGLIHDCGSFTLEYQYTHKPMLFLRRDTQVFGQLGLELMKNTYCADGRDFAKISDFIEKVLIAKYDPEAQSRREFFDKHLNYRMSNGLSASEYVFNAIDQPLSR